MWKPIKTRMVCVCGELRPWKTGLRDLGRTSFINWIGYDAVKGVSWVMMFSSSNLKECVNGLPHYVNTAFIPYSLLGNWMLIFSWISFWFFFDLLTLPLPAVMQSMYISGDARGVCIWSFVLCRRKGLLQRCSVCLFVCTKHHFSISNTAHDDPYFRHVSPQFLLASKSRFHFDVTHVWNQLQATPHI